MSRLPALGVALGVLASVHAAAGAPEPTKAMTDLDDAMACLPLDGGTLAVGTGGGLALVSADGRARTLTALDGLPDTRVHALASAPGGLWVGTETGAAFVALGGPGGPSVTRVVAPSQAAVHAILPIGGATYVGTWGAGVVRVTADGELETVRGSGREARVAALAERGGDVYVAYADGPAGRIVRGAVQPLAGSPTHGQALASVGGGTAGAGALVLGDIEGLFRMDDAATPLASVDARAVAATPSGMLVASFGQGLLEGTDAALHAVRGVPRFVRGVAVRGEVRCAATPEGVYVAHGDGGWSRVALGGPPSNDVTALARSGARMAIGTFDRGAAIVRGEEVLRVKGLEPNETINAAVWQGDGPGAVLWLGTAHGLVRVAPDGGLRRWRAADGLPASVVRAILVLPDGRILAGTDEGPAYVAGGRVTPVEPKAKGPTPLSSPMHAAWALAATADGTVWIGTMSGLYAQKDGAVRRLSVASGDLKDDWVTALVARGQDLFVGTYAGGVTRLRAGAAPVAYGGGCINPAGLALLGDDLYAATMEGLLVRRARENQDQDDHAAWAPVAGAAPGRDVTAVALAGDGLWVASRRGIGVSRRAASP